MKFYRMAGFLSTGYTFGKDIFLYVKGKDKFVKKLDENFMNLTDEVESLKVLIKQTNEDAERNESTHDMSPFCKTWLDQADKTVEKCETLNTRYQKSWKSMKKSKKLKTSNLDSGNSTEENPNSQIGKLGKAEPNFFQKIRNPNVKFFKLAKLSSDIVEKTDVVRRVMERRKLADLLIPKGPEQFGTMPADDIHGLPLLYEKVKEVLNHLEDVKVKSIGIYAPPGVAITALLNNVNLELKRLNEELNNQALPRRQYAFDMVIYVPVGGEGNVIRKIQKDIVANLRLPIRDDQTDQQVAGDISRALQKKRYLLILDDVYSNIILSDVGIHREHTHGKVVIAALNKSVLKRMKPDQEIHVEKLSEDDAWTLFTKYVGDVVNGERIKDIATRVVKELGGLPLVIKAMGVHMKDEWDESIWNTTLVALQSNIESASHELHELGGLCSAYKMVYDKLPPDQKKCLLYGALFPEDYGICKDYVVESWRAERFIQNIRPAGAAGDHQLYRVARDKGRQILRALTGTCLLEWSSSMEYVKMPIIFKRIALKLLYPTEEGYKVLVRAGEGIEEHPVEEEWTDAKRVSLMCNKMKSLPNIPGCSNISTLLLQQNESLTTIDDLFFGDTSELRLLDLSQTRISHLSLTNVSNLKGLYITGCDALAILPTGIESLQNLEVLDMRGTRIQYMPSEIQFLEQLRCFRFSYNGNPDNTSDGADNNMANKTQKEGERVIVPSNFIEKLHKLEELTIIVDHMDKRWNVIANGIAKEVASLKALTTLCFYFPSINILQTFISESRSWNNQNTPWRGQTFRSFNFQVGFHESNHSYCLLRRENSAERHLKFSSGEPTTSAIKDVLKQASTFELIGHGRAKNLSDFGMENMKDLEVCVIEACSNMVSVVDCNRGVALPLLEKLHIINLQSLKCICDGPLKQPSLAKLIVLTLSDCPSLSKILSSGMCHALSQLQHLRVKNCRQISTIIEAEYEHGEITSEKANLSSALPKLKTVELVNLPELVSISRNTSLEWLSLEKIVIKACKKLRDLSLTTTNARQLKLIECDENWWLELELIEEVKERLNRLICCFVHEEQPATQETLPEAEAPTREEEIVNHQPHDLSEIPNHTTNGVNYATKQKKKTGVNCASST